MRRSNDDVLPPGYCLHWYQLQSVLGDGGFGITYLGRDTNLNQSVAIKEYFPKATVHRGEGYEVCPDDDSEPGFFKWGLERFLDEARLLARFRHPHIVRVLSVFEALGTAYMVMELERGESLTETVNGGAVMSDEQIIELCLPLMDGLEMVHDAGFIHRDVKPGNILLRPTMGPVLIDFGSARQPHPGRIGELTSIVSRGYAPYEQYEASNDQKQGPWTDIYGLAATVYFAINGTPPTDAMARGMCMLDGEPDPYIPMTECAPGRLSARLLGAVDSALAFKSVDRPRSVGEWREMFPVTSKLGSRPQQFRPRGDTYVNTVIDRPYVAEGTQDTALDDDSATNTEVNDAVTIRYPSTAEAYYVNQRILVVDDDRAARVLAQRILSNLGATRVDLVGSGEEALARFGDAETVPELLICDLEMPNMDGVQLLCQLAQRNLRSPLVIMGDADDRVLDGVRHLAKTQGLYVLGSIRKPLTPKKLLRILARRSANFAQAESDDTVVEHSISDEALRDGLSNDALQVVYLPKVSLKDRELIGAEALVRWTDSDSAHISADSLVQRVDALGLSDAMTEKVLQTALEQTGEWRAAGLPFGISINMFAPLLGRLDLPEYLSRIAGEQGVSPRDITLEVDQVRMQSERQMPLEIMVRLRLLGIGLSLDRFGTGSSVLIRLRYAPFTELKVDRSFVMAACEDRTARYLLESSVAFARRLKMRVVAEGVADEATWELVERMGFDAAQGYFISAPMPGNEMADWSREWRTGRGTRR